jgi:hypothetical protein
MPAFEFVSDRNAPNQYSAGEFTPHADQKKYASIWGLVDGEGTGFFRGSHIQQGIYSADGRAKLCGEEYQDAKGNPHEIKHRKAVLREYIVPIDAVKDWNAYEAAQGDRKEEEFRRSHEAKMRAFGLNPQASDIEEDLIEVRSKDPESTPSTSVPVPGASISSPKRGRGRPPKAQPVS